MASSDDDASARLEREQQAEIDEMEKQKKAEAMQIADQKLNVIKSMQGNGASLFNAGVAPKTTVG